ncbi:hypothetical protein, partial [Salmonella enterica]|uniref:hypothetical protein n=1 Tax=Salmonella enterica TaxID=28901 RepID=UPI003CF661D9
ISGDNGRLEIAGVVENDANVTQKEVEVTGNLTNNEGKTITADSVKNTGTLTSKADDIVTATINNNGGTFNVNGGTISGYDVVGTSTETSK